MSQRTRAFHAAQEGGEGVGTVAHASARSTTRAARSPPREPPRARPHEHASARARERHPSGRPASQRGNGCMRCSPRARDGAVLRCAARADAEACKEGGNLPWQRGRRACARARGRGRGARRAGARHRAPGRGERFRCFHRHASPRGKEGGGAGLPRARSLLPPLPARAPSLSTPPKKKKKGYLSTRRSLPRAPRTPRAHARAPTGPRALSRSLTAASAATPSAAPPAARRRVHLRTWGGGPPAARAPCAARARSRAPFRRARTRGFHFLSMNDYSHSFRICLEPLRIPLEPVRPAAAQPSGRQPGLAAAFAE